MADTFTPEQITQILEEFFKVVGTRKYIGERYVPIFGRKGEESIQWDNSAPYEPLTIVLYQGNSYTSRQYVPIGVEITNQEFWVITGNYNTQVEAYHRETIAAREIADNAITIANNAQTDIDTLLPKADFSAENTVKKYIDETATVQDGSITTEKLADGAVTDAKLAQTGGVLSAVAKLKGIADEVSPLNLWEPTESGYYYSKGGTKNASDYFAYQTFENLSVGDVINGYYWYNDSIGYTVQQNLFRFVTAYNGDSAVSSAGAENVASFTVPEGITKVIVSVQTSVYVNNVCVAINNEAMPTAKQEYFPSYDIAKTDASLTNSELPANAKAVGDRLTLLEDIKATKFVHISIDDVTIWADLIANDEIYVSAFDNVKLAYLKQLHDVYGAVFTLNCFIQSGDDSISDVPSKFATEFAENASWLKFSFHGTNINELFNTDMVSAITEYYETFVTAIYNMTGTFESIDRVVRLSSYTGTLANVLAIRDCDAGVKGLLTSEGSTGGYYLSTQQSAYLAKHNHMLDTTNCLMLIRSFTRIPTSSDPTMLGNAANANYTPMVELFWHDTDNWTNNYWKTAFIAPWMEYLTSNGYRFAFAEHVYNL